MLFANFNTYRYEDFVLLPPAIQGIPKMADNKILEIKLWEFGRLKGNFAETTN